MIVLSENKFYTMQLTDETSSFSFLQLYVKQLKFAFSPSIDGIVRPRLE
jgi:hypothetical protein